jgi:hypothetical protein
MLKMILPVLRKGRDCIKTGKPKRDLMSISEFQK